MKKMDRLYLITDASEKYSAEESGLLALKNGIRLVQLRMKDSPKEEIIRAARDLKAACKKSGARLIINDFADVALEAGADGVHLGQTDGDIAEARRLLGKGAIIGKTCNTASQVLEAAEQGADYVGVGPYRFTTTKKNLSPILGVAGYRDILAECATRGIEIPIYAIGGVETKDVEVLLSVGVYGIAVSSFVLKSENPKERIAELRESILKSCNGE